MLIANVSLILAPAALLFIWAYRRDVKQKGSGRLLITVSLFGVLSVGPAILAGVLAEPLRMHLRGPTRLLYDAFVVAALVEEGVKFVLLSSFVRRHADFAGPADGLVYGMSASLGFALLENALYAGGPTAVVLLRSVTAVPLHAGCGALIGYFIGLAHADPRHSRATGFLLAVLLHGSYDAAIFAGPPVAYIAILIVAGLAVAVAVLMRQAARRENCHSACR